MNKFSIVLALFSYVFSFSQSGNNVCFSLINNVLLGNYPVAITSGDFNNDGNSDIATIFVQANDNFGLYILLADGLGNFSRDSISFSSTTAPIAIISADFNKDGNADLATINRNGSTGNFSVFIGNGTGGFNSAVTYLTGNDATDLICADLNKDGNLDLAAIFYSDHISIIYGNGNGTFSAVTDISGISNSEGLCSKDFNMDGNPDIAVAASNGLVGVKIGDGTGNFGTTITYQVEGNTRAIASADFNGDGKSDIATSNLSSNNISVLISNGDGTFAPAIDYPAYFPIEGFIHSAKLVTGDYNQDGFIDIVTVNYNLDNISILPGRGDGTFGYGTSTNVTVGDVPTHIVNADMDGDGDIDLLVLNNGGEYISILTNNAPVVSFSPISPSFCAGGSVSITASGASTYSWSPASGLNNTSTAMVVASPATTTTYAVTVSEGACSRTKNITVSVKPLPTVPVITANGINLTSSYAAGNTWYLNGTQIPFVFSQNYKIKKNGNYTVVVTDTNNCSVSSAVYNFSGFGSNLCWNSSIGFNGLPNPQDIIYADFNNDGKTDLLTLNSGSVSVLLGNGLGFFNSPITLSIDNNPIFIITADFNKDGKADLATANSSGYSTLGSVSVLFGNGDGTFGAFNNLSVDGDPFAIFSADFNKDGNPDIVASVAPPFGSGTITLFLGDGIGGFGSPTTFAVGSYPRVIAGDDFNKDGNIDLAVTNYYSNNISVLFGNGSGSFSGASPYATTNNPSRLINSDFNQDGNIDLAALNTSAGIISILLGDTLGGFDAATTLSTDPNTYKLVAADFNGNGKIDLAMVNNTYVSLVLGDGQGNFSSSFNFTAGNSPNSLVGADFNGDGKIDIATANIISQDVSVILNSVLTTPIISANDSLLTSSSASGNQWYLNGNIISGATSPTHIATQNGSYTVSVSLNGCSSTSAAYNYPAMNGIAVFSKDAEIKIFPVPTTGDITINSNSNISSIEVYNIMGQKIYTSLAPSSDNIVIDLSPQSTGVYFIFVKSGDKFYSQKLIKQ